jgi:hypothetical protein
MELAILQISAALKDAEASTKPLGAALCAFSKRAAGSAEARLALQHLQFFDKLSQRLAHVQQALQLPASVLAGMPATHSPNWSQTIERIRSCYTTADERALFDFFFKGLGSDVLRDTLQALQGVSRNGELDLF